MNIKNGLICVLIVAILSLCTFNSVAAAPVSKQTPDIHSNYAADVRGGQQTYLITTLNFGNATTVTMWVGQYVWLTGVLSSTHHRPHGATPRTALPTRRLIFKI